MSDTQLIVLIIWHLLTISWAFHDSDSGTDSILLQLTADDNLKELKEVCWDSFKEWQFYL